MKLVNFKHQHDYLFTLFFENGETKETDLSTLIEQYVSPSNLNTAHLNSDWGCLEFNNGMVDIDPKTLYCHATVKHSINAPSKPTKQPPTRLDLIEKPLSGELSV
jgi:hypothetical protein